MQSPVWVGKIFWQFEEWLKIRNLTKLWDIKKHVLIENPYGVWDYFVTYVMWFLAYHMTWTDCLIFQLHCLGNNNKTTLGQCFMFAGISTIFREW